MPYKDPARAREHSHRYTAEHPQDAAYYKAYYADHAEQKKTAAQARRDDLRAAVFGHYGESCGCCGSTEQLTIDHIDGNGRAHRIELFGRHDRGGVHFYRWLIEQGFPDGFQVLCKGCNASKRLGERCRLDHDDADAAAKRRQWANYMRQWRSERAC